MNEQMQPPVTGGPAAAAERFELPFDQQVKEMAHQFESERYVPTSRYGELAYLVNNMDRVDGPDGPEYRGPSELGTIPSDQAEAVLRAAEITQEVEKPGDRPFSKLLAAGHIQAEGENAWLSEMYDELDGKDSNAENWGQDTSDKALFDAYRTQRHQRLEWGVPANEDEAEEMVGNAVLAHGFESDAVREALLDANTVISAQKYAELVHRGRTEVEQAHARPVPQSQEPQSRKSRGRGHESPMSDSDKAEQLIATTIEKHGLDSDEFHAALGAVGHQLDPELYRELVLNGEAMIGEDHGRHARRGRHARTAEAEASPEPEAVPEAAAPAGPGLAESEGEEARREILGRHNGEAIRATGDDDLDEALRAAIERATARMQNDEAGPEAEARVDDPENGIEYLTEDDFLLRTEIGNVTVSGITERGKRGERPEWPEKATQIGEGILHLSREGAGNLLAHTDIRGDGKAGRLTRELIEQSDLMPRYSMKAGERYFAFSQAYDLGGGRIAVLGYVQDKENGGLIARSYYRSGTHAEWRYLPQYMVDEDGEISWYSKGYGEESLKLPAELQKGLATMLEDQDELVHLDEDTTETVFSGTARTVGSEGTVYHKQVEKYPRTLGIPERGPDGELPLPEQVVVNADDEPDFENVVSKWEQATELYGRVRSYTYRSKNGDLLYTFNHTEDGRAGVGGIENNSPLESTGLHQVWLTGGPLTTPIAERPSQAGGYGGEPEPRNNRRVDMFNNYLWRIPMIQRFLRSNPDGAVRAQPQPPARPARRGFLRGRQV